MHIGDKVRFLNQTGGGIIVGFDKKDRAIVEDEDGFEIPVSRKECVVVSAGSPSEPDAPAIQSSGGDKLKIALIYIRTGEEFECILANADNYHLLATYLVRNQEEYFTRFAGPVLPFERKSLFKFGSKELNGFSKKALLRILPFKKDKPGKLKPVIEAEFILDPVNLLKETSFKENEYIPGKGYAIVIADETKEENLSGYLEARDSALKKELFKKFQTDAGKPQTGESAHAAAREDEAAAGPGVRKKDSGSRRSRKEAETIEIDLHAHELLDTTSGMSNGDILNYQIEKFNEAMMAYLNRRGTKLIFIHGKGDGVLRAAILKELKTKYSRCTWQDASFKEYGFGATMVTIR